MKTYTAAPRAGTLIESMRDIGYSLETALADIIDNSVTAGASRIDILVDTVSERPRIGILDNGSGMSEVELLAAMRLGSTNPLVQRGNGDLGRFGLGLKTASFSQCRHLSVLSRKDGKTNGAIWDLGYVAKTDQWLVQIPDDPGTLPWASRLGETGTLVVWTDLDRVLDQDENRAYLNTRIDSARRHLELIFHRFLAGEPPTHGKIAIFVNDVRLTPWDPFPRHSAAQFAPKEKIKLGDHVVDFQAVTLPHHSKVTRDEWERFGGEAGYLKNQGFYVYRERRLIIHGTWFGLVRQAELTKLARVRIDLPNGLDAAWKVDVKKSSAQLPYQVRERLRRVIEQIGGTSKRMYTRRGARLVDSQTFPLWYRSKDNGEISYCVNLAHPVLVAFLDRLPAELEADFTHILRAVGSALPMDALFADLGNHPGKVSGDQMDEETLRHFAATLVSALKQKGMAPRDILSLLEHMPPFNLNWEQAGPMIEEFLGRETE